MAAGQQRRGGALPPPPPFLLLLCLGAAFLPPPAAVAAQQQSAQDYVVVFKRGFDASKVMALCAEQQGEGQHRNGRAATAIRGLCRKRFSAVLNGFAGACIVAG